MRENNSKVFLKGSTNLQKKIPKLLIVHCRKKFAKLAFTGVVIRKYKFLKKKFSKKCIPLMFF